MITISVLFALAFLSTIPIIALLIGLSAAIKHDHEEVTKLLILIGFYGVASSLLWGTFLYFILTLN